MISLQKFILAWSSKAYPPTQVSESELLALEKKLGISFPEDYRESVLELGLPSITTDLWDWIDDEEESLQSTLSSSLPHLSELHDPKEVVEALEWQDAGLPIEYIPFANDSSGNQFCFSRTDLKKEPVPQAAVYFWDHDFLEIDKRATSFTEWLELYLPK